jgi:hypothetical protein
MPRFESQLSIQESLYSDLTCFGYGHANPDGLHLRNYREGGPVTPRSEQNWP